MQNGPCPFGVTVLLTVKLTVSLLSNSLGVTTESWSKARNANLYTFAQIYIFFTLFLLALFSKCHISFVRDENKGNSGIRKSVVYVTLRAY